MDIRVQQGNFAYSFIHSYIRSTNISQATTLFHAPCQVLKSTTTKDTVPALKVFTV